MADFYNPNSTQNTSGFINTERAISALAIDLSALGITAANSNTVAKLVYITSGQSDPAFIAYNEPAMSFPAGLSVSSQPLIYHPSAPLASPILVQLRDGSNNAVQESNVLVQVTIESGNGTLLGTLSALTDANGLATFNNLRIAGNGDHVLRFNSDGIDFTVSQPVVETTILPVKWKSFTAYNKDGYNVIKWTTEDEAGSGEYIVERIKDGNNFREVGRVNAKGKSINQYQFSDPFFSLEKVYYRIAAKDASGKLTYSKIVSIEQGLQKFKLFPNPAVNGRFMVSLPAPKLIKVYNSAGLLLQKTLPAGYHQVDVTRFGRGSYVVDVEGERGVVVY